MNITELTVHELQEKLENKVKRNYEKGEKTNKSKAPLILDRK